MRFIGLGKWGHVALVHGAGHHVDRWRAFPLCQRPLSILKALPGPLVKGALLRRDVAKEVGVGSVFGPGETGKRDLVAAINLQSAIGRFVVLWLKCLLRREVWIGPPNAFLGTAYGIGRDPIGSPVRKLGIVIAAEDVDLANDQVVSLRRSEWAAVEAKCGVDFLAGRGR